MRKYAAFITLTGLIILLIWSCGEDLPEPSIELDETERTLKVGDKVAVMIFITDLDFARKVTIEKTRGGEVVFIETMADSLLSDTMVYEDFVELEDTRSTLVYQCKVYSENTGNVADQMDLVVTIEQSPEMILLSYDWQMTSNVLESTGAEDIRNFQKDDFMRFYADHNYDIDYGTITGFFDGFNQYCGWIYEQHEGGDTLRYSWYTRTPKLDGRHCRVLELSRTSMVLKYTLDLTIWGLGIETYTETYVPFPLSEDFVPYRGLAVPENAECDPYLVYNFE